MSTSHGSTDDTVVIERFKEALERRIGPERFRLWFGQVRFEMREPVDGERSTIVAIAGAQFAADRLAKNFIREMRGAAGLAIGATANVVVETAMPAKQAELPFASGDLEADAETPSQVTQPKTGTSDRRDSGAKRTTTRRDAATPKRAGMQSLASVLRDGRSSRPDEQAARTPKASAVPTVRMDAIPPADESPSGPSQPTGREFTWETFIPGACNELARGACRMAIETPSTASPLVLWGPAGSGKTHLLKAVASKLRLAHRMKRIVYLSAEQFTNDFLKALNGNSLPAFRARFRDADALLIDDIHFFVDKKATVRELHHTVELLAERGKPLLFAGMKTPSEIKGLGSELAGRLASGLVCQMESLDLETRKELLVRYATQRCPEPWPETTLEEISNAAGGDGRVLSGITNTVSLLQRMDGAMPSMEKLRKEAGHLLRATGTPVTLSAIERAVERLFHLDNKSLCSGSQVKKITEPRMLAMYLSRELTSSAFSEIGTHYGGRSHSTAILANQRVRQWRDAGKPIGKGPEALSADEAIRQIESMLKSG
ncbi:MAG: DnaA/Hda family protein [Planctomycetota bacterium]